MGATNWCQGHGVRPRYYTGAPYHVSRKSCGSTAVKRRRKVARKCTPAEERGCKLLKGNSSRDRDAALASEPVKRKKLRLARADLVSPPLPPDNSTRIALPSTNSFLRSSGAGLAGKSSSPPISRQAQHIVTREQNARAKLEVSRCRQRGLWSNPSPASERRKFLSFSQGSFLMPRDHTKGWRYRCRDQERGTGYEQEGPAPRQADAMSDTTTFFALTPFFWTFRPSCTFSSPLPTTSGSGFGLSEPF